MPPRKAPMSRGTAPLRRDPGEAKASVPVPRAKRCRACKAEFAAVRPMQVACGGHCAAILAIAKRQKDESKAQADERRADKAKREAMMSRAEWLAKAKVTIQRFRRLEELSKGSGCMSCKRTQAEVQGTDGWKPGGAWDGGHFIGKGARPELALEPLCIWLQCKSCNGGSGKYARKGYTVNANFRANLIAQEGLALVEWLEGPHKPKKYTADELKTLVATYRAKARNLERQT